MPPRTGRAPRVALPASDMLTSRSVDVGVACRDGGFVIAMRVLSRKK